jgi:hypothetical protein
MSGSPTGVTVAGSFDAVLHLSGQDFSTTLTGLADAVQLPAVTDADTLLQQVADHAGRSDRVTILADALDESHDPFSIAGGLLRRLAGIPGVQVLLGTRRSLGEDPDRPETTAENLIPVLDPAELLELALAWKGWIQGVSVCRPTAARRPTALSPRSACEGDGSYRVALARYLRRTGLTVVEVDRPDRKSRRSTASRTSWPPWMAALIRAWFSPVGSTACQSWLRTLWPWVDTFIFAAPSRLDFRFRQTAGATALDAAVAVPTPVSGSAVAARGPCTRQLSGVRSFTT